MVEDLRQLIGNGLVAIFTGLSVGTFLDVGHLRLLLSDPQGLNYSIYQVEVVFIFGLIGFGLGVPISYVQKHIKPYYTIVIGCLGSTVAVLLLWTATVTKDWYKDKTPLLALFNLLAGYSVAHLYLTSLWIGFSASQTYLHLVTFLHHLPLVSSALLLWVIFGLRQSYLFTAQFLVTIISSLAAIVFLRTSPTFDEPVRVVGEARRFTLPAYEYPVSDTESIAESEVNTYEPPTVRTHLLPQRATVNRILSALRDAIPHIVVFSLGVSFNMPTPYETVPSPYWRLATSIAGASLASFLGAWRSIPRANFLMIVLALRILFLFVAVCDRSAPHMDEFLFATGGIVQGAFWTTIPQMLFELHGYKRITILWSTAILSFAGVTAFQAFGTLAFLYSHSSLSLCTSQDCPLLISEFQLAANVCTMIAAVWLHSRTAIE